MGLGIVTQCHKRKLKVVWCGLRGLRWFVACNLLGGGVVCGHCKAGHSIHHCGANNKEAYAVPFATAAICSWPLGQGRKEYTSCVAGVYFPFAEMGFSVQHVPEELLHALVDFYNDLLTSGNVPTEWSENVFIMLAKKVRANYASDFRLLL